MRMLVCGILARCAPAVAAPASAKLGPCAYGRKEEASSAAASGTGHRASQRVENPYYEHLADKFEAQAVGSSRWNARAGSATEGPRHSRAPAPAFVRWDSPLL